MGSLINPRFIFNSQGWLDFISANFKLMSKERLLYAMLNLYVSSRKPPVYNLTMQKLESATVRAFLNKVVFNHTYAYSKIPFVRFNEINEAFDIVVTDEHVSLKVDIEVLRDALPDLDFTAHIDEIRIWQDGKLAAHHVACDEWLVETVGFVYETSRVHKIKQNKGLNK